MKGSRKPEEIVLVTSGHLAMDHRIYDKEAVTLAEQYPHVRIVGTHAASEFQGKVWIHALRPCRSRLERFLLRPLHCFLAACKPGSRRTLILHDAELLFWAPLVKLLTGDTIIYDVHENFSQLLLRRAWIPPRLRASMSRVISFVEKACATSVDGVIGVTETLAEHFAHRNRVAIYNLPSREFILTAAERARPLEERTYDLVHLGTLSEERLEFLCTVLDAFFSRRPAARALVIGVRPDQQQALSTRFPAQRVSIIGKIPYGRVSEYLGTCRIGLDVHPVLYPHLRCAVPVKVFEYMAAGCNIVTSYLPELHRLLGDDGAEHVVTMYTPDPGHFVEEICRLLDSPESLERHQTALMQLISRRLNWELEAQKLVTFIGTFTQRKETVSGEQVLDHQC
ncbi:MAG TPA: glycosyltransferase [Armatimonadota bacterium]|jgi:glycosyltransferase involved in cell wall biosynthesis